MLTKEQYHAVCSLIKEVGQFQVEQQRVVARDEGKEQSEVVQSKGVDGPFTYVDKKSEEMLSEGLKNVLDVAFRGEETTEWSPWQGLCWVVDPLDGTMSYLWRKWHWSVSVALFKGNEPVACFVYNPLRDTMYTLFEGKAYRDDQEIRVKPECKLISGTRESKAVLYDEYVWDGNGSAALACAMAAAGELGAYAGKTGGECFKVWDVAAGLPILLAAGGSIVLLEADSYKYCSESPDFPPMVVGHNPFINELAEKLR